MKLIFGPRRIKNYFLRARVYIVNLFVIFFFFTEKCERSRMEGWDCEMWFSANFRRYCQYARCQWERTGRFWGKFHLAAPVVQVLEAGINARGSKFVRCTSRSETWCFISWPPFPILRSLSLNFFILSHLQLPCNFYILDDETIKVNRIFLTNIDPKSFSWVELKRSSLIVIESLSRTESLIDFDLSKENYNCLFNNQTFFISLDWIFNRFSIEMTLVF